MGIFDGGDDSAEQEQIMQQKKQIDATNRKLQQQRIDALRRSLGGSAGATPFSPTGNGSFIGGGGGTPTSRIDPNVFG